MRINNGYIYINEEKKFCKKDLVIENGRIAAITECEGSSCDLDADGQYILPGLIEAHSHIGICEEALGWEGDDLCEYSDPVIPEVRAIDGINPMDIAFKEALSGGVTVVCTGPGSANVIGGQFALIKTSGAILDEMILNPYAGLKCALGENPKECFGKEKKLPMTRMGIAMLLRKTLIEADNYRRKKEASIKEGKPFDIDIRMEAMLPILAKEVPLKIHVHRADDICTAIRIAEEFKVKITLDHCTEGHLVAAYLKQFQYPALVGPSFGSKSKIELKNKSFVTPKVLHDAGVQVCIVTDHNVLPQQTLIMCAALAVKEGLEEWAAIKAITETPATVFGIDDRKGKISIGHDADISIWDRHPLDIQARATVVFYEGNKVY